MFSDFSVDIPRAHEYDHLLLDESHRRDSLPCGLEKVFEKRGYKVCQQVNAINLIRKAGEAKAGEAKAGEGQGRL